MNTTVWHTLRVWCLYDDILHDGLHDANDDIVILILLWILARKYYCITHFTIYLYDDILHDGLHDTNDDKVILILNTLDT